MPDIYPGVNPSNVSRDAKYSVINTVTGTMAVRLVYRVTAREKQLLTTEDHKPLVDMVNAVKKAVSTQSGGTFYINEYCHVLVPSTSSEGCYYAGHYGKQLEFDFEGQTIGPCAPDGLQPGDIWPGPHVGVKYTLTAGAADIRYKKMVSPNRTRDYLLSDYVGLTKATRLAQRLGMVKGGAGGAIYINECSEFFAPINRGGELVYRYLGHLDPDDWFPEPALSDA